MSAGGLPGVRSSMPMLLALAFLCGATAPLRAAEKACRAELGAKGAARLVQQCLYVSPATHPPCHADNPCALIRDEIQRGCALIARSDEPPKLCALYLAARSAAAEEISGARYESPVERYGHFALGRPHEYARVAATTDAGRQVALELPEDEVFEDLAPRVVRLARGQPAGLLAIVSSRMGGSRLALLGLAGGRLEIVAQSAPIGTPSRWLNPVGAADLDGDGVAEIAAVTTPHIGGVLRVYRREGARLREVASLPGFSNHVYGTSELRLSAMVASGDRARLLVPDATRRELRLIAMEGGQLLELRRCALPAPLTGPVDPNACREALKAPGN